MSKTSSREWKTMFRLNSERGAVAPTVAIVMIVLIGFTALAVDGGIAYNEKRSTQNAADHAALAAAWELCNGGSVNDAETAAEQSAALNGYSATDVTVTEAGGEFTVEVTAVEDTTFGAAAGTDQITVVSAASADCDVTEGPGQYALFAGGDGCSGYELNAPNSFKSVTGGVHTNGDFQSTGATADYWGPTEATYVGAQNVSPSHNFHAGLGQSGAKGWPVPAYWVPDSYDIDAPNSVRADAAFALGQYQKFYSDKTFTRNGPNALQENMLYFVDGDVMINAGPGIDKENVTIVATGDIHMAGASTMLTPYEDDGLVLFSWHDASDPCNSVAIHGSAAGNGWEGIMYAPHGQIRLNNAGSMTLNGGLIGHSINLAGAGTTITYNEDYGGPPQYAIELTG